MQSYQTLSLTGGDTIDKKLEEKINELKQQLSRDSEALAALEAQIFELTAEEEKNKESLQEINRLKQSLKVDLSQLQSIWFVLINSLHDQINKTKELISDTSHLDNVEQPQSITRVAEEAYSNKVKQPQSISAVADEIYNNKPGALNYRENYDNYTRRLTSLLASLNFLNQLNRTYGLPELTLRSVPESKSGSAVTSEVDFWSDAEQCIRNINYNYEQLEVHKDLLSLSDSLCALRAASESLRKKIADAQEAIQRLDNVKEQWDKKNDEKSYLSYLDQCKQAIKACNRIATDEVNRVFQQLELAQMKQIDPDFNYQQGAELLKVAADSIRQKKYDVLEKTLAEQQKIFKNRFLPGLMILTGVLLLVASVLAKLSTFAIAAPVTAVGMGAGVGLIATGCHSLFSTKNRGHVLLVNQLSEQAQKLK